MLPASERCCRRRERGRGQLRRHRATCGRPPARGRMTGACALHRGPGRPDTRNCSISAAAAARIRPWHAHGQADGADPCSRSCGRLPPVGYVRTTAGRRAAAPLAPAGPCRFRGRSGTPPARVPAPSGTAPLPATVHRQAGGSRRRGRAPSGTAPLPAAVHAPARPASPAGVVRQAPQAPASVACGTASRMGSGRTAPCCRCAHFTPS